MHEAWPCPDTMLNSDLNSQGCQAIVCPSLIPDAPHLMCSHTPTKQLKQICSNICQQPNSLQQTACLIRTQVLIIIFLCLALVEAVGTQDGVSGSLRVSGLEAYRLALLLHTHTDEDQLETVCSIASATVYCCLVASGLGTLPQCSTGWTGREDVCLLACARLPDNTVGQYRLTHQTYPMVMSMQRQARSSACDYHFHACLHHFLERLT